jgi:hypothetical protein
MGDRPALHDSDARRLQSDQLELGPPTKLSGFKLVRLALPAPFGDDI